MHHFWTVEDVIRNLLLFMKRSSQASLGSTCRLLFDIAMDNVWVELYGLGRLSAFLTDAETGAVGCQESALGKSRATACLDRLNIYLPRVRALTLEECEDRGLLESLISDLGGLAIRNMLTGLRTVSIDATTVTFLASAASLVPRHALVLNIELEPLHSFDGLDEAAGNADVTQQDDNTSLGSFLEPLLRLSCLDHLGVSGSTMAPQQTHPEQLDEFLIGICQRHPEIRSLDIVDLYCGPSSLFTISTLSRLVSLTVLICDEVFARPIDLQVLTDLRITATDVDSLLQFLGNLKSPLLIQMRVAADPNHLVDVSMIQAWHEDVTRTIAAISRSLRELVFMYGGPVGDVYPFSWFQPLLECRDMVELTIANDQAEAPMTVADEHLFEMGRSWPALEVLNLGFWDYPSTPLPLQPPVGATLLGLSELAKNCLELRELSVHASLANSEKIERSHRPLPLASSVHVSLYDCPPCSPPAPAASAIITCFPEVRMLRINGMVIDNLDLQVDRPFTEDEVSVYLRGVFPDER